MNVDTMPDLQSTRPTTTEETRRAALDSARAHDRGRLFGRVLGSDWALYPASFSLAVLGWYLTIWVFRLDAYLLPAPHRVLEAATGNVGLLLSNSWVTLVEILAAFGLSIAVGVPLGILIGLFRVVDKLVNPLLVLSQGVPKIALAPVLLAWFGFGFTSNLAIGFLIAVFPIVVNTVLGVRGLDPALPLLGKSLSATPWRLFWVVRLPSAMPSILAGMKISVTFAAVGAIIGEFVAGSAGLGYLISVTIGNLSMALGFAAIVAVALVGWVTYIAVEILEWAVLRRRQRG